MPKKKTRLSLNKLTVVTLADDAKNKVLGGYTGQSGCCTIMMQTCIPNPDNCWPGDTIPPGGKYCA